MGGLNLMIAKSAKTADFEGETADLDENHERG